MIRIFNDLDEYSYRVSELTKLSQPQASMAIESTLLSIHKMDKGRYVVEEDDIKKINSDKILEYKPYSIADLAAELENSTENIKKILGAKGLLFRYKAVDIYNHTVYLINPQELEELRKKFPQILENVIENEMQNEDIPGEEIEIGEIAEDDKVKKEKQHFEPGVSDIEENIQDQKKKKNVKQKKQISKRRNLHNQKSSQSVFDNQSYDHGIDYNNDYYTNNGTYRNDYHADNGSYESHSHADSGSYESHSHVDSSAYENDYHVDSGSYESHSHADNGTYKNDYQADNSSHESHNHVDSGAYRNDYQADNGSYESHSHADNGTYKNDYHADNGSYESHNHVNSGTYGNDYHADNSSHESHNHVNSGTYGNDYHADNGGYESHNHADNDSYESHNHADNGTYRNDYHADSGSYESHNHVDSGIYENDYHADNQNLIQYEVVSDYSYKGETILSVSKDIIYNDTSMTIESNNEENISAILNSDIPDDTYFMKLESGKIVPLTKENYADVKYTKGYSDVSDELDQNVVCSFINDKGTSKMFSVTQSENFTLKSDKNNHYLKMKREEKTDEEETQEDINIIYIKGTKKRKHNVLGYTFGALIFEQALGRIDPVMGYRQFKRYTSWMKPISKGVVLSGKVFADKKILKKENKLGTLDVKLKKMGVDSGVLKKKNGKYKKKLSNRDLQMISGSLNRRLQTTTAGNVNLTTMSDRKLKSLEKELRRSSSKDAIIVREFRKIKAIKNARMQKKLLKGKAAQSLMGLFGATLVDADFYQGAKLCQKYIQNGKRAISFVGKMAIKTKRAMQFMARKMVRPYDIHVRKKQVIKAGKQEAKNLKKQHKRKVKQTKKAKRIARRKNAAKRAVNRTVNRLTGKTLTQWGQKVSQSAVGRGFNAVRGKLSPVKRGITKVTGKTFGLLSKMFGFIGKLFSIVDILKHFALYCCGIFILSLFVAVLALTPFAAVLDLIPDFSASKDLGEENPHKYDYAVINNKKILLSKVENDLKNGTFILLEKEDDSYFEKVYNGTTYWLTKCDDMSKYGGDKKVGYFLVPKGSDSIATPKPTTAPTVAPATPAVVTSNPPKTPKPTPTEMPKGTIVYKIASDGNFALFFYSDK